MKKKAILSSVLTLIIGLGIGGGTGYVAYSHEKEVASTATELSTSQESIMAFDWLMNSGEAEALEYQAYNVATDKIQEMAKKPSTKPKAVVLDIDETVLNNGPGTGYGIASNKGFNIDDWNKWVDAGIATPIPGAVEFTKAAKAAGVQVFYISNRDESKLDVTVKNLEKYGFADATEKGHVILDSKNTHTKNPRFVDIEKNYDVVMFVGDQLTDMNQTFSGKTTEEIKKQVEANKAEFGDKYVVIPNPTYGGYMSAMFGHGLTDAQKAKVAQEAVKMYDQQTGKVVNNTFVGN